MRTIFSATQRAGNSKSKRTRNGHAWNRTLWGWTGPQSWLRSIGRWGDIDEISKGNQSLAMRTYFFQSFLGNPLPKVTWWQEGSMFDSTDEVTRTGLVVNQMVHKSLTREDLFKIFVCQASNTNRTHPVSRKVKIVLNRKHFIPQMRLVSVPF